MKLSLLTAKQNILRQEQESDKRLTKKRRDFNALLMSAGAGKRKRDMSGTSLKRRKIMGEDVVKTFVDKLIAEIQTHERNKDGEHTIVIPYNANEIRKAYVKAIENGAQNVTNAVRARIPTNMADHPVTLQYEIIYEGKRGEASKMDDGLGNTGTPNHSSIIHDLASIGRGSPNIQLLSRYASRIQCFLIPYERWRQCTTRHSRHLGKWHCGRTGRSHNIEKAQWGNHHSRRRSGPTIYDKYWE